MPTPKMNPEVAERKDPKTRESRKFKVPSHTVLGAGLPSLTAYGPASKSVFLVLPLRHQYGLLSWTTNKPPSNTSETRLVSRCPQHVLSCDICLLCAIYKSFCNRMGVACGYRQITGLQAIYAASQARLSPSIMWSRTTDSINH